METQTEPTHSMGVGTETNVNHPTAVAGINPAFRARIQKPSRKAKNRHVEPPSKESLRGGYDASANAIFKLNQRILDGKAVINHVMSDTQFVVYHEDFRREFVIKKIPDEEDIRQWIDL